MSWEVQTSTEFSEWFRSLDLKARKDIAVALKVLQAVGPQLGRPQVDTVYGSKFPNMKELRVQSKGRPFRIFFAFDPKRQAAVLIGGDKTGNKRFYGTMIRLADEIYTSHLKGDKK